MFLKNYYVYLVRQVHSGKQKTEWGHFFFFLTRENFLQAHIALRDDLKKHFFYFCATTSCWWRLLSSTPWTFFAELPQGPVGQIVCLEKEVVVLEKSRLLLSPPLGCCFSWGFPDNSCTFANNATEKVRMYMRIVTLTVLLCSLFALLICINHTE